MIIKFKTISNKTYELELYPTDTIGQIREKLGKEFGLLSSALKFIHLAKVLTDEQTIEECGIDGTNFVILHIQNIKLSSQIKKEEKKKLSPIKEKDPSPKKENITILKDFKGPQVEPLPIYQTKSEIPDPVDFEEKVKSLISLGFSKSDCEQALRSAVFNSNRAAEFLLSGHIPDLPKLYHPSFEEDKEEEEEEVTNLLINNENEEEEEDFELGFKLLYQNLKKDPNYIYEFLNEMAENNPSLIPLIKNDPAAFLASIGINPTEFDLSKLNKKSEFEILMSKFTNKQKEEIHRLELLGFDTMIVIQVYEACDRNEEIAKECLLEMK